MDAKSMNPKITTPNLSVRLTSFLRAPQPLAAGFWARFCDAEPTEHCCRSHASEWAAAIARATRRSSDVWMVLPGKFRLKSAVASRARSGGDRLHWAQSGRHRRDGRQDRVQKGRREGKSLDGAGPPRRDRGRKTCGEDRRTDRLPRHDQGFRRRRRQGHADRAFHFRSRRRVWSRQGRSQVVVRRRPGFHREIHRRSPPHRDSGIRGQAWQRDLSRRARMFDPAPQSEGDRGSAVAAIGRDHPPLESSCTAIAVRNDPGVEEGGEISLYYDRIIPKLVTLAPTRPAPMEALAPAFDSFYIEGIRHNIPFLSALMHHPRWREGNLSTGFIAEEFPKGFAVGAPEGEIARRLAAVGAAIDHVLGERKRQISGQMSGRLVH